MSVRKKDWRWIRLNFDGGSNVTDLSRVQFEKLQLARISTGKEMQKERASQKCKWNELLNDEQRAKFSLDFA
jgi:hypothetical protein